MRNTKRFFTGIAFQCGLFAICPNIQGVQMAKSPHWNAIPVKNRLVFRIRKLRIVYQGKLSA
ncbi:MAG: hypothetical protein ACKOAH_10920, partial [Pirellula sp.]